MAGPKDYQNAEEWIGSPGQASVEAVPIDSPEVDVSHIEQDDITPGIPIDALVTGGPEVVDGKADKQPLPDPQPLEHYHLIAVAANVALLIKDNKTYREVVTITGVGDAAQFDVSHRSDFLEFNTIATDTLPVDLSIHVGRQLWLRQNTAVDQTVDFLIEPRGSGR